MSEEIRIGIQDVENKVFKYLMAECGDDLTVATHVLRELLFEAEAVRRAQLVSKVYDKAAKDNAKGGEV